MSQNKKWKERIPGKNDYAIKTAGFQNLGIVMKNMFEPLNFDKKFKLVIEYDATHNCGSVYFKYYECEIKENEKRQLEEEAKAAVRFAEEIRDDTINKKWEERIPRAKDYCIRVEGLQTLGSMMGNIFKSLNYDEKFKIVIEHDPLEQYGNDYFKIYV